jgi:hypothetical protein
MNQIVTAPPSSHTAEYIALVVTVGVPIIVSLLVALIRSLSSLRGEQGTQSEGLALLVQKVGPVDDALTAHDTRLRTLESGHARLEGAVAAYRDTIQQTLTHLTRPAP